MVLEFRVPKRKFLFGALPKRGRLFGREAKQPPQQKKIREKYILDIINSKRTEGLRSRFYNDVVSLSESKDQDYVLSGETDRADPHFIPQINLLDFEPPNKNYRGMVTGETGCGKTSAMYKMMLEINKYRWRDKYTIPIIVIDPHNQFIDKQFPRETLTVAFDDDADIQYTLAEDNDKRLDSASSKRVELKTILWVLFKYNGKSYKANFNDFGYFLAKKAIKEKYNLIISTTKRHFRKKELQVFVAAIADGVFDYAMRVMEKHKERGSENDTWVFFVIDECKYFTRGKYIDLSVESLINLVMDGRKCGISYLFGSQRISHMHLDIITQSNFKCIGHAEVKADFDLIRERIYPRVFGHPDRYVDYFDLVFAKTLGPGQFDLMVQEGHKTVDYGPVHFKLP